METPFFNSPETKLHVEKISLKPEPGFKKHKGVPLHVAPQYAFGKSKSYPGQELYGIASPAPFGIKSFTALPFGVIKKPAATKPAATEPAQPESTD